MVLKAKTVSIHHHSVQLSSYLISNKVHVGVVSQLPIRAVDILLGRRQSCCFSIEPLPVDGKDELATRFPSTFPACAVTRSMSKQYMTLNDRLIKTDNDGSDSMSVQMLTETQNQIDDDKSVDVSECDNNSYNYCL